MTYFGGLFFAAFCG